ncbi:MAG: hypothetical protein M3Y60_02935 [Bacteroidota bacterium]|nr:hypothetical protein [Bacteroidota bacterium]
MKAAQDKQNLVFENVWEQGSEDIRRQVLALWNDHGGPIGAAGEERAKQLVFVVLDDAKVVGVSTSLKVYVRQLRNYMFAVRLLIAPEYRIPGLTSKLLVTTRDYLESIHSRDAENPAIGIITLVENPRLKAARNEAIWPASRMVYIGNSAEGHHIRVYYFKGARIKSN